MARAAWARTRSDRSVATWSFRERAVYSLPPSGPISSVSRRSIAMWMSSSSSRNSKESASSSPPTWSRPSVICPSSSSSSTPSLASARACAFDCAMSNDARRQSKEIEELIRLNSGSCSSSNRDMRLSLGLLTECFAQCRADLIDLRFGHRGEERQGQGALSYALGNRELAPLEAEALAVGRQQVDAGQIRLGGDPVGCQRLDHRGAIGPIRQLHAEDEPAAPLFAVVLARQDDVVAVVLAGRLDLVLRSEEHTSELQS